MTASDSAFRHDVADAVLRLPVAAAFGITFTELADGRAEARLAWRPELSHASGVFQASPIATLADFTGGAAAVTLLPPGSTAATIDYTAKFLTEARGDHLIARARVLRPGATLTVVAADIYVVHNTSEVLCATALVTMRNIVKTAHSADAA
ncbi:MAG: PaaI family thioesterase [Actinomycetia bacterium]|nr:PaaI family thioesterase [Actinomycetes bacterium]